MGRWGAVSGFQRERSGGGVEANGQGNYLRLFRETALKVLAQMGLRSTARKMLFLAGGKRRP